MASSLLMQISGHSATQSCSSSAALPYAAPVWLLPLLLPCLAPQLEFKLVGLQGDNWSGVMMSCYKAACASDASSCGGPITAAVFFYSFSIVVQFSLLNLFVAVCASTFRRQPCRWGLCNSDCVPMQIILDRMHETKARLTSPLQPGKLAQTWSEFDPKVSCSGLCYAA